MTNYALLEPNVQDTLENSRKDYLEKRQALVEKAKHEIAIAALVGIARAAVTAHPDVRYVNLVASYHALLPGIVHVTDVFDADHNVLAEEPFRGLCMKIEKLFAGHPLETYAPLKTGEYDLVELAGRSL